MLSYLFRCFAVLVIVGATYVCLLSSLTYVYQRSGKNHHECRDGDLSMNYSIYYIHDISAQCIQ